MKIQVVDWGDDAYARRLEATGEVGGEVIAEVEIEKFTGFSFDGGRLDINGHPETIWVMSHQWSLNFVEAQPVSEQEPELYVCKTGHGTRIRENLDGVAPEFRQIWKPLFAAPPVVSKDAEDAARY